jgi:hypothetical protein
MPHVEFTAIRRGGGESLRPFGDVVKAQLGRA